MGSGRGRRPGVWPVGRVRAEKGLRRWRAVARSAARQSRRAHIPPVDGVLSTAVLTQRIRDEVAGGAVVLVLHESATDRIADVAVPQARSLLLVVGPEGGVAPEELAALTDAGAIAVRLGPQVLRTSTAAAVALGALGVLTPRWQHTAEVESTEARAADQPEPSA
jgi:16S rRNA (uracil1498-N3)-methyltransferase